MATTLLVNLHGVSYENADGSSRQELIEILRPGETLTLRAEPMNPHDRHAVAVFSNKGQLGYLPSDARDSSSILRGEKIAACVRRVYGGPRFWHAIFGLQRFYGVTVELTKEEPDWKFADICRAKAKPSEELVAAAAAAEKSGRLDDAVTLYGRALEAMVALNATDPVAAAHRYVPVPINRLTLLLQKQGQAEGAIRALDLWHSVADPIGLPKAETESVEKRERKLRRQQ